MSRKHPIADATARYFVDALIDGKWRAWTIPHDIESAELVARSLRQYYPGRKIRIVKVIEPEDS